MIMIVIVGGMKWHEQILWTNRYLHMDSDYISRREIRPYMAGVTLSPAILNRAVSHRKIYIKSGYLQAVNRYSSKLALYVATRWPKAMSILVVPFTDWLNY